MSQANPQQLKAIQQTEGPVLIIAGPGSGKTYTLVERICNLITNHGATPESMLVVTFTEKAARELTTRISNKLVELGVEFNLNEMYLGTFHSICLRILEEYREYTRLKRSFMLMDQFDQQYFVFQRLKHFKEIEEYELVMGPDTRGRWGQSSALVKWLNKVAEEGTEVSKLEQAAEAEMNALAKCFQCYQGLLVEQNSLDFSGIQYETLNLLQQQPAVLKALQDKLSYLMVDEYQDTNTIQEKILLLLMGDRKNLCVVGDDDQGLYRFRGATIRNILEFPRLFNSGECKQISLTTNYRSHPDIIWFYNRWMADQEWDIRGTQFRFDKRIEPREGEFPELPTVVKASAEIHEDWHEEVHKFLTSLQSSGKLNDWNQVAFLFRSVKSDKVLELARYLESNGIPVYSPRSNLFFEREEVRLMIGALIFLFPQFPSIRKTREGMELSVWQYYDHTCFRLFTHELRKPENNRLLEWARPLAKKHLTLTQNADYGFGDLFYQLLQFPLFSRYLDQDSTQGTDKGRAARNLATLSKLLTKFEYLHYIQVLNPEYLDKNIQDLFNQFFRFLYDGGIDEYEDEAEFAPSGCVSFLTIHQSKGLEFPVVICGSLEAVPRKQYSDIDETFEKHLDKPPFEPLEFTKYFDFKRLFYTAFSRAQNLLVLSTQEKTGRGGRSPSKSFEDFYNELPSWKHELFKPELLTLEPVKEINLKKEYSFTSHITLYENCAEQYRFFKELEFTPIRAGAQLFGTLVHQTIEDIHKAALRGEQHIINKDQIAAWFSTNYHHLSKRERQYLAPQTQKAALKHVQRYFEREEKHFDRLAEAEVDISLVKENYILRGSVDLIRGENNTVEIIDFKSEKKPDLEKESGRLKQYQRQLEVYAHLVEQRTGHKVSRTHLYYTGEENSNPYVTFDKNTKSIDNTIAQFDSIVDRIEAHDYQIAARPAKQCTNCDMRPYCDMKNWTFKKECH